MRSPRDVPFPIRLSALPLHNPSGGYRMTETDLSRAIVAAQGISDERYHAMVLGSLIKAAVAALMRRHARRRLAARLRQALS